MKIYLIRHGQTDWNKLGLIQGRTDNKLNDLGKKQAKDIVFKLKEKKFNALISSSLSRANQTLNIIKKDLNINLENKIVDGFIERDFGELEKKDAKEFYKIKDYSKINGYENNSSIEKRVNNAIKDIINHYKEEDNILVCCHSHVIKAFLVSNFKDKYDYSIKLENCCILEITISEKVYKRLTFI